jgi:hypothetical protein
MKPMARLLLLLVIVYVHIVIYQLIVAAHEQRLIEGQASGVISINNSHE